MFSLVITVISIALVTALALATIYYGGSAFKKGQAEAAAAQVILQGQQLLGAAEVFRAALGYWPASMQEMVDKSYLSGFPVASSGSRDMLMAEAMAAASTWQMPVSGEPTFTLTYASQDQACQNINLRMYGTRGILAKAYTGYQTQCYGNSSAALQVVVSKTPDNLAPVLAAGSVAAIPAPAASSGPEWFVAPTAVVGGGAPLPPVAVQPFSPVRTLADYGTLSVGYNFVGGFPIVNTSSAVASFTSVAMVGSADWTFGQNTCTDVAPGATCYLGAKWTPSGAGQTTATILVGATQVLHQGAGVILFNQVNLHIGRNDHVNWGDSTYFKLDSGTTAPGLGNQSVSANLLTVVSSVAAVQKIDFSSIPALTVIRCQNTVGYDTATQTWLTGTGTTSPTDDSCYVLPSATLGHGASPIRVQTPNTPTSNDYYYVSVNILP